MTEDPRQSEYAKRRRVRMGYLDHNIRDKMEHALRTQQAGEGHAYEYNVAWMPPIGVKDIGRWDEVPEDVGPDTVVVNVMRYRLTTTGPCYYVTCEGYLVDKWWRKGDTHDLSDMGR